MNKSILILEENSMIHGLIASALDLDGLTLHHEFDPDEYVGRAKTLMPDLILLSNADQQREYAICRELRRDAAFRDVPLVLLANSKDRLHAEQLRGLSVGGVIRKPFEASDVQQQVSKHLNLVDLIGSAYDYKKSQSLRDEGMGPLADMEVLDQEILGFLRESADQAQNAGAGVPQVDFSRELDEEPVGRASTAPMVEEAALEEALEPERAFEPVSAEGRKVFAESESPAGGEVALAGADFDEMAAAEREEAPARARFDEPMEELDARDVLDEGADEEQRWAPAGFDQDFDESAEGQEAPMERVEMELAGADVDFDAAAEELDEGEVELFEADFGKGERPARGPREDEMIPEAVRRMVEMKPVLTMAQSATREEEARTEIGFAPEDEELTAMAEELEQMDEIQMGEAIAAQPADAHPEALAEDPERNPEESDWELAAPGPPKVEDEDEEFFHEDYLGDDEVDEEKIRQALEAPGGEPDFEFVLDEDEEFERDALEDSELKEIEALETVDLDLGDDGADEEEIIIDPDEESMVLASIEQDEALEEEEVAGAPALHMEEPRLEAVGEETPEEGPAGAAEDLLDRQLEALEQSAENLAEAPTEPLRRTFEESAMAFDEAEFGGDEEGLAEETWEFGATGEGEDAEPFIAGEAREMAAFAASAGEPGEEAAMDEPPELFAIEEPETLAAMDELAEFSGLDEELVPSGMDAGSSLIRAAAAHQPAETAPRAKGGSDFDSVLAELQAEIEANPVGENLDDVLAKEAIVEAVEAIDFTIPQHEQPFTRAMGALELPGRDSVSEELLERVTARAMPVAVAVAASAMGRAGKADAAARAGMEGLHEGIVTRLSEVLDEMIRDTVRRVVREEVPHLMERMRREESGHGR